MRVEEVRQLLRTQPFRPFTILLADGFRLVVSHHDAGVLSSDGRTLYVHDMEQVSNRVTLIDVMLIAAVQTEVV